MKTKTSGRVDGRPSFQFYPGDWLEEPGLKLCSLAAQGLWIHLICRMWYSPERGVLRKQNGSKAQANDIAVWTGTPEAQIKDTLRELQAEQVCSTHDDGTIYSRRMVRDERTRKARADAGAKGGKGRDREAKRKQTPSKTQARAPAPARVPRAGDRAYPARPRGRSSASSSPTARRGGRAGESKDSKETEGENEDEEAAPPLLLLEKIITDFAERAEWEGSLAPVRKHLAPLLETYGEYQLKNAIREVAGPGKKPWHVTNLLKAKGQPQSRRPIRKTRAPDPPELSDEALRRFARECRMDMEHIERKEREAGEASASGEV